MKIKSLVATFLLLALVGCEEDEQITGGEVEVFSGTLKVYRKVLGFWRDVIDTVVFTVDGVSYSLQHKYDENDFCDSWGRVANFSTNTLTLFPTSFATGSCDSVRFPRGEFKSIFRGDSLIMEKKQHVVSWEHEGELHVDTLDFTFLLTK